MKTIKRRKFLASVGATSAIGLAGCTGNSSRDSGDSGGSKNSTGDNNGQSSNYPSENISLIVPYATGGGFDSYARISKPFWQKHLPNQPTVNVENVVGGGGVKGATQVYNAEPNGYNFLIWDAYQAVTQQIGRNVGYHIREMSHIGALTQAPNCLVTMKSANISGWNDLVNRISEVNFATQGVGAISHTSAVLLGELTGAWSQEDINFVHYGGTGEALAGLERGEAQVFIVGSAIPGLKVVNALEAEMTILFGEPVDSESVLRGVPKQYSLKLNVDGIDRFADLTVFRRFFTEPPNMPEEILEIQREAFSAMVNDKEFRQAAQEKDRPLVDPGSAEQVSDILKKQFDIFGTDPLNGVIKSIFQS